jgi:hypothetical protein
MPRSWGQGGLSPLPLIFLQTLAAVSLSPLVCWNLHPRAFPMEPVHKTIVAEPSPWSFLRWALIQNNHRAFLQDLRSRPSPETFVGRPSPTGPSSGDLLRLGVHQRTFSGPAFVKRPSLVGPSSANLLRLGLRRGTFSSRAFSGDLLPSALYGRPSPTGLLQGAFYSQRCSGKNLRTKVSPPYTFTKTRLR